MAESEENTAAIFAEMLHRHHFRVTPERLTVFLGVRAMRGHFTIGELEKKLSVGASAVSHGTLFSAIKLLESFGMVHKTVSESGTYYESVSRGALRHYHLVCNRCGRVVNISPQEWIREGLNRLDTHGFAIKDINLTLSGLCSKCQRKK